jgi:hypothetical protein
MEPHARSEVSLDLVYLSRPDPTGQRGIFPIKEEACDETMVHVRWQSLAEPQTYSATLEIPEEARKLVLTRAESQARPGDFDYRKGIALGLAPGAH